MVLVFKFCHKVKHTTTQGAEKKHKQWIYSAIWSDNSYSWIINSFFFKLIIYSEFGTTNFNLINNKKIQPLLYRDLILIMIQKKIKLLI